MRKLRTIALTTSAVLAAALVLAGCAPQDGTMPGMDHGPGGMTETTEPAAEFNAADEMFVTMMIPHHQQAIDMADIVLAKPDVAPQVTELAQQIKDAQGPEIETMRGWLADWGVEEPMGGMDHGDGMMSEDDMTALEDASGPEASRLFLEQMIVHHQGAIEMAEMALESAQNPDVTALATQVIEDQTAEIATMQDLLATLWPRTGRAGDPRTPGSRRLSSASSAPRNTATSSWRFR